MQPPRWAKWVYGFLFILFATHLLLILKYVPDIPIMDEWDIWYAWDTKGFWTWLFDRHNEHMVVPTRLHMYISTLLFGAHPTFLVFTSFFFYGALLFSCFQFFRWAVPERAPATMAAFMIFLLSALPIHNHISGFHSQFHFVLLFLMLALPRLFGELLTRMDCVWGVGLLALMLVSFSTGPAQALATLAVFALYWWKKRKDTRSFRRAIGVCLFVGFLTGLWLAGHHRLAYHPLPANPFTTAFNSFFVNLVSFGFGLDTQNTTVGCFTLLFIVIPAFGLLFSSHNDGRSLAILAGIGAIFGAIATIAYGRGNSGPEFAKGSRYGEIALLLIPLVLCAWSRWLNVSHVTYGRLASAFWCVLFIFFLNSWTARGYRIRYRDSLEGIECLKQRPADGGFICQSLYPRSLRGHFDRISRGNAAFLRGLGKDASSANTTSQEHAW